MKKNEFINFNDEKVPIGKRKQAYIKWAVSKGTDLEVAKKQANKKFGFEQKPGILAVVKDWDNRHEQRSFDPMEDIWWKTNLKKYKNYQWILTCDDDFEEMVKRRKSEEWDIIYVEICS